MVDLRVLLLWTATGQRVTCPLRLGRVDHDQPVLHCLRQHRPERRVAIGSQPFNGVAIANAINETAGFMTFVTDVTTDRILGCHIVGPELGNLPA